MDLEWGIVVNTDDPVKAQRVQVRIYGYYDDIPEEELPWCHVLRGATETLTFNIGPSSHTLVNGSQVLCAWLDKNQQQPIVLGQVPRIDDCNEHRNLDAQIINTSQGHKISLTPEKIEIVDNKETSVTLDKEGITLKLPLSATNKGNMTEDVAGSKSIKVTKDFDIIAENCNITCSGNTKIDASSVSIKNITGPNQFCKIPACLFTGAPHISPSTEE